jgi:novobiocin biosynthesis protein NovU/D-mycarose 3-C-methyltransferase
MNAIIDLGEIPLVNNLCLTKEESLSCKKFPLKIIQKEDLIMKLELEINSNDMFFNYLYRTAVNTPYIDHCKKMWKQLEKYNPKTIVDIGGNDGSLLKSFRSESKTNLKLINVDASSSFKEENEKDGIIYHNAYWGDFILDEKIDLITSTNVFQHNPDYRKFLKGIKDNLNGIWVLEFPYFLHTVETNQFDQIYHEHVYYWLVTPLVKLFREYNLKIQSIAQYDMHGGSLRIISSNRAEDKENKEIINYYLSIERDFNFKNWGKQTANKIIQDYNFINSLNGKIAVFGAAAKGCVYLNSLKVSNKISYIVDDTKEKQNKFCPGTGLKIVSKESFYKDNPDYLIILAHNFKDYIIESIRNGGFNNTIITMIPEIKIH